MEKIFRGTDKMNTKQGTKDEAIIRWSEEDVTQIKREEITEVIEK